MKISAFKLIKDHGDAYEVEHPGGHNLMIDKKGLSDKAHGIIQKLADGGDVVSDSVVETPEQIVADAAAGSKQVKSDPYATKANGFEWVRSDPTADPNAMPNPQPNASPAPPQDRAPSGASVSWDFPNPPSAAERPAASATPAAPEVNLNPNSNSLLMQDRNAIMAGANAEGQMGKDTAAAYEQLTQLPEMQTTMQDIFNHYQKRDDELSKAFITNKIDPDRYLHNLSTGSKIAGGIGLILSGIGSGLTGQPNLALGVINKAIDRDIDAQKNAQGQAATLWKMNREKMGGEMQATLATQNQMLTIVKAKTLQAQAQAQGPMAQARAAQILLPIDQQIAANNQKLTLLNYAQNPSGFKDQIPPEKLVQALVPPEHQKEVFGEIKQAQAANQNMAPMLQAFDQADKENTAFRAITHGGPLASDPPSIKALKALCDPLIHDLEGRINEAEQRDLFALFPAPGDLASTVQAKRNAFVEWMNKKRQATTANAYGIDVNKFHSTGSKGEPRDAYKPDAIVMVKGKKFQVAKDGNTLIPVSQ